MTAFGTVVQTAIYQTLTANAPLMAEISAVYDDVPQGESVFPYVTIGEDILTDASTDSELMSAVSVTVHVWSRERGRKETKKIQGLIYDALNRVNISATGYKFITITEAQCQSAVDADGITRHGVQTYNLMIEEI